MLRSYSIIVQRADLLSRFIMLGEDPELNFTNKTLRDIILNFIIAGKLPIDHANL